MEVLAEKKVKLAACGEEHMGCLVLHGWVPDEEAQNCMACKKSFTPIRRRVSLFLPSFVLANELAYGYTAWNFY